jgi:hypothetical protein
MAKMSFTSENKSASQEQFPRLKLVQDETARIHIYEAPDVGFVHNLRMPTLVNGMPKYKSGPKGEEMEFDFVGNPICLGKADILQDRGMDPKNCPACKAAEANPDQFQRPKRRFAMHVFQYATNGTSKPTKTFQGSVKIWAFTDQKFNEIADLRDEAPNKDISKIDVILGPCENQVFQKYKIISSSNVKKDESERNQELFDEITEENKVADLEPFLGRVVKKVEYLEDDLDKIRARWRVVNGQASETNSDNLVGAERNLDAGLEGLLDNDTPKTSTNVEDKPARNKQEAVDLDDLLSGL